MSSNSERPATNRTLFLREIQKSSGKPSIFPKKSTEIQKSRTLFQVAASPSSNPDVLYDVIVVGAGIEGSATAHYLTTNHTRNVLLLEQFTSINSQGSSHGGSRITEKWLNRPAMDVMYEESAEMWSEIEKKCGQQIFMNTGRLHFGTKSKINDTFIQSMQDAGVMFTQFSGKEANEKYSKQLKLPEDYVCIHEEEAGILRADVALAALQKLYLTNGGKLLENHKVTKIIPGTDVINVVTSEGSFNCRKLIITAGAWTNKVLKDTGLQLPLKVFRTESLYHPVKEASVYIHKIFPVINFLDDNPVSLIPVLEYDGLVKITCFKGSEIDPDDTCSTRLSASLPACLKDVVVPAIEKHFHGVNTNPALIEPCIYTVTPDNYPCLDHHVLHSNIIIGAGFSGYGFKFAPIVGKILSELAYDLPHTYNLTPFKINRF